MSRASAQSKAEIRSNIRYGSRTLMNFLYLRASAASAIPAAEEFQIPHLACSGVSENAVRRGGLKVCITIKRVDTDSLRPFDKSREILTRENVDQ
jgi:hypothetical protein